MSFLDYLLHARYTAPMRKPFAIAAATSLLLAFPVHGENVPEVGRIVFFRGPSVFGAVLGCPIRYHGDLVVDLSRGHFAEWVVPAGEYVLTNGTSGVTVNVVDGSTHYVRCMIKTGFLTGRSDLLPSDKEQFEGMRASMSNVLLPPLSR